MGDRANYVVVEGGSWELYYSHWGAVGLELDLLAGPEAATRLARGQRLAEKESGWLSDVWGEGAALIDLDNRVLLYYSAHYEGFAGRAAVLEVLARTWPGWEVRWAYDGHADLVAYVGQERSLVRDYCEPDGLRAPDEDHDWLDLLVTVGGRAYGLVWFSAREALDTGVGLIEQLPEGALLESVRDFPEGGVHLDPATRTAGVWSLESLDGCLERVAEGWPGWTWEMWEDRYQEQVERSGVVLPEPNMPAAYADLRERFVRHRGKDPLSAAKGLVDALKAEGRDVTTSPHLFDHQVVNPGAEADARALTVIEELAG